MPTGQSHTMGAHEPVPANALSDDQFATLMGLLTMQHQALVELLEPIQKIAVQLLAEVASDRAEAEPVPAEGRPDRGPGNYQTDAGRSDSEQSSG